MNFNAKLPQFPAHRLQPSTIRDICIGQEQGLDLVNSEEDRDEFRKGVAYQLDAYKRTAVRYAVGVMGARATGIPWEYVTAKVANAWICERMTVAM